MPWEWAGSGSGCACMESAKGGINMIEAYTAGALLTCAMIYSSNRATEMPWLYLAASSILWPLWWAGFGIDSY